MTAPTRHCTVYAASSPHSPPEYLATAYRLGERLAQAGWTLVYGGGSQGSMGAVADGALAHGVAGATVVDISALAVEP